MQKLKKIDVEVDIDLPPDNIREGMLEYLSIISNKLGEARQKEKAENLENFKACVKAMPDVFDRDFIKTLDKKGMPKVLYISPDVKGGIRKFFKRMCFGYGIDFRMIPAMAGGKIGLMFSWMAAQMPMEEVSPYFYLGAKIPIPENDFPLWKPPV